MNQHTLGTKGVSIEFPGVKALDSVDFEISTGEIRAVVGANGAGKSTLMKILAGANPTYTGDVYLNDEIIDVRTPITAKIAGIQIVYQEVDTALIPTFSVGENVMLNETVVESKGRPFMNWGKVYEEASIVLDRLNININPRTLVQNLTLAEKQMVLIARAIQSKCNFLILDEPTAPLSDAETTNLFNLVKHLRETENIAIIFISHRINEVLEICDTCTVMRNGIIVDTLPITKETTTSEIVEKMLGRTLDETYPKEEVKIGDTLFEVNNISIEDNKINDISLKVQKGEIVGIAGLVGAGKSELCKTLFGDLKTTSGDMVLEGKRINLRSPSNAVKNNIGLIPEERRKEGVFVEESVAFNFSISNLDDYCTFSFINPKKINENAEKYTESLGVVTPSIRQIVKNLSGGNQQKVSIGKWLASDCKLYIFDEPTKGVDVGAKHEIFGLIGEIAKQGNGIIYASCENPELLSITDRIYVMYDGKIMAELITSETSESEIMYYSVGGDLKKSS